MLSQTFRRGQGALSKLTLGQTGDDGAGGSGPEAAP
jgi:hypothetical protein